MSTGSNATVELAVVIAVSIGVLAPGFALAQTDSKSSESVVKITCDLGGGKRMNATGFAWQDSQHVVTALHAVAGCVNRVVFSEAKGRQSPAVIEKVILEADLALLKLERNLELVPVKNVTLQPNLRERFMIWGYPHAVNEMIETPITFGAGRKGGVTTLSGAYAGVDGLAELFAGQGYPREDTSILRVTTTLQPGQSGAPIFDLEGRVVAMADGGLLGGWKGINWSIPAHVYLPRLLASNDEIPKDPSKWAQAYSANTANRTRSVAVPPEMQARGDGEPGGELRLVRTLPLGDVERMLSRRARDYWTDLIPAIKSFVTDPEAYGRLSFDIYEDPVTGATVGVPSGLELTWNGEIRVLEARTKSGVVRGMVGVSPNRSYAAAKDAGKRAFVGKIRPLATWDDSLGNSRFTELKDEAEHASQTGFHKGVDSTTGKPVQVLLSLTVTGKNLLGYAVYVADNPEKLTIEDAVANMMMQLGAVTLSGFSEN